MILLLFFFFLFAGTSYHRFCHKSVTQYQMMYSTVCSSVSRVPLLKSSTASRVS